MLHKFPLTIFSRNIIQPTCILFPKCLHTTQLVNIKYDNRTPEERYKHMYKHKFIPSKYRVAMSAYENAMEKKQLEDPDLQLWSDGSKQHPLEEDPMIDYPQPLTDGGLKYYGFTYYPPHDGVVETLPPDEISPLFMVRRVKLLKGIEWYYKDILTKLGIGKERPRSEVAIVKNIPEMNAILYAIKHFIEITPIKLPKDLPLDADPRHCFLTEEGVFSHDPSRAVPEDKLALDPEVLAKRLDDKTITRQIASNFYHAWDLVPK